MQQLDGTRGLTGSFSVVPLILPFYLPAFLSSLANGLAIPLLPLYAESFNHSGSFAGIIVGMYGMGSFVMNVPAGLLSNRIGDRKTMILSILMEVAGAAGAALAPSTPVLAVSVLVLGGAQALFFVSRLSFFRRLVPSSHRGRALAILGGEFRLGATIGPVIGGFVAAGLGYRMTYFGLGLLALVVVLMILRWIPSEEVGIAAVGIAAVGNNPVGMVADGNAATGVVVAGTEEAGPERREKSRRQTLLGPLSDAISGFRGNGKVFATAGAAIIMLQLVRAGRRVILPLWGSSLQLNVEQIGLTVGIMYMVELALFIPAGFIMDRLGRKWAGIP